ncbi:type IV toxin-antitoxin system AbiEi family antitoxin domain-containing protein [Nocardioides panacisoli]|uniref:AbiEi antitoxin N-terminal domain-containing protein n=1 Tax=Nocardioides panacisoli TaxID=627624 RepID=A0ABP7IDU9_9ACTN
MLSSVHPLSTGYESALDSAGPDLEPVAMNESEPLKLPAGPFRGRDAAELDLTKRDLRSLVERGTLRRVCRGVYADADLPDSIELRANAAALVTPADHVVCDRTAAWIHGVDMMTAGETEALPPIDTCAPSGRTPPRRSAVDGHERALVPSDVITIGGVRVTTPLRTALDLGARLHRRDALAAMDSLCRLHGMTAQMLTREVKRFRRRRGVVQLRELVALVDPRAESQRESWTRLEIHDAGLPLPTLQHWVVVDGRRRYRLDLAYPGLRIVIEYDGFDDHRRTHRQVERDLARRRWLHDQGWIVIVVRVGDFTGEALDRWLNELRFALKPSYINVRRLERGDRERLAARTRGDDTA